MAIGNWKPVRYEPELNTGCWLWNLNLTPSGYGQLQIMENGKRRTLAAHRQFYAERFGPIPPGMLVCHRCDTPACVNPDHLFLGTYQDNMDDMWRKGRGVGKKGVAPKRLTEEARLAIFEDPGSCRVVSITHGVNMSTVRSIKRKYAPTETPTTA